MCLEARNTQTNCVIKQVSVLHTYVTSQEAGKGSRSSQPRQNPRRGVVERLTLLEEHS